MTSLAKALNIIVALLFVVACTGDGLQETVPTPRASSQSDGAGASVATRAGAGHPAPMVELVSNLPRIPSLTLYGPNVLFGVQGEVRSVPRAGGMPNVLISDEMLKNSDMNLDIERLVVADSTLLIGAAGRSGYYRIVRLSLDTGERTIIIHFERGTFIAAVAGKAYYAQNESLLCSFPIKGGPRQTIKWDVNPGAAIADSEALYLVDRRHNTLLRFPTATQSSDVLLSGIARDAALVQDETNVFVSSAGLIRRLAKNGSPPVTIYAGQNPRVIAVAGDTVFFVDGAIKAISNVGGVPRTLASTIDAVGSAIADGRFLYVAASKGAGLAAVYRIEYAS